MPKPPQTQVYWLKDNAMAHKIFICHSARDKQIADAACAALEAQRIPCWIAPRDVLAGDEWGKSIIEALNGCEVVVLIFSAHANESVQVRREIERAVSLQRSKVCRVRRRRCEQPHQRGW